MPVIRQAFAQYVSRRHKARAPPRRRTATFEQATASQLFNLNTLLLQLEFARLPSLVKPRLQRAVEAKDGEPPSAGNGPNPVTFFTRRRLRTEVEVVGAVSVLLDARAVASLRGKLLVRLKHGSRLCVVNDHRPKVLGWRVSRYIQFVVLTAVEVVVFRIQSGNGILRTNSDHLQNHGRGHSGVSVEKHGASVEHASVIVEKEVETGWDKPGFARIVKVGIVAGTEFNRSRSCVADGYGVGQDLLHALVRGERLALLNSNRQELAHQFGTLAVGWLFLNQCVGVFVEAVIVGANGVERLA